MLGHSKHAGPGRDATSAAGVRALQALDRLHPSGSGTGLLVYYKAVARNPYQRLLYSRCWEHGIAPVPTTDATTLSSLPDLVGLSDHLTLHLHWTAPIMAGADSETEADRRAAEFLATVDELHDSGGTFVWTMHNLWPHELRTPAAERAFRQGLAARADRVHVLTKASVDAAAGAGYPLPQDRVVHVPHPGYQDAYPARSDVTATRISVGLDPTTVVLGMVGAIRPYKRADALLDAFDLLADRLPPEEHPQLLVAGPGADQELADRLAMHPTALGVLEELDDQALVDLVRACDVIVLPYEQSLNSGALVLALSCARPVVAPDTDSLREVAPAGAAEFFDPTDPASLADALARATRRARDPDARTTASRAAARLAPERIGTAFAAEIRALWSGQQAPRDR